ncbi:hypothetical protein [Gemmatimonas aurantiaca]|nr:hypothetical protein [Gemmatimonas aurantiaca]
MMPRLLSAIPARSFARPVMVAVWSWTLLLQIGCYSHGPIQTAPPPVAEQVGVVLNDRGRALLADRVGPIIQRIEGRQVKRQNGEVTVAVSQVVDLRGNTTKWTGEEVTIPEDAIMGYQPRKFSKLKTFLLVGAVVAGIAATIAGALDIFGTPRSDLPGDPPSQS